MVRVLFKQGTRAQFEQAKAEGKLLDNALYFLVDEGSLYKKDLLMGTGKEASQVAAGLLSPEDKALLDNLVAANLEERVALIENSILNKVDDTVAGYEEGSRSIIRNENQGGLLKYEHADGTWSAVAVNNGGKDGGIAAQVYAIDKDTNKGVKLDVTKNGIYYTVGDESGKSASERDIENNELVTRKDLVDVEVPEYSMRKDENPGDYAAIYHLTKDGVDIGEAINIAKDQMLKSVTIKTCTEKGVPLPELEVGDKYIDFEFETTSGAAHSYIAIKDMVKPYTAGAGIIITSDNVITYDPDVLATVDYVDGSISDTLAYIDQQDASEHAGRVAGDNLLDARIKLLEMAAEPEFDEELNILFLNGNAVRIYDNGTANVAEWFGEGSKAGLPSTLEFPYEASIACGGNAKDKAMRFSGAQLIMDGGDVKTIRGGGLGSCVVGNTEIIVNGGRITSVTGGGQKKYASIIEQNTVNAVHIMINGGTFYGQKIVCAGGTDAVSVGHAVIDFNAGEVDWFYASGANGGYVNDSVLNLNGGKITNLLGVVRGYISNTTMNVNGTEITNMFAGNDEDPTDDGVIKNVELNILGGSVSVLKKGQSKAGAQEFNCYGKYAKGIIGNESTAVVACNLVCNEVVDGYGNNLKDIAQSIVWEPIIA